MKYLKKLKWIVPVLCIIIVLSYLLSPVFSHVQLKVSSENLINDYPPVNFNELEPDDKFIDSTADFSVNLFKESFNDKENILISPLSVMLALSIAANGADNETLTQLQNALSKDIPLEDLNKYLYSFVDNLSYSSNSRLDIANSIWMKDHNLVVEKDFLKTNSGYYRADIYKSPFDNQTVTDINNWVSNKTNKMIRQVVDKIDPQTVMYIINTVYFDARWMSIYKKNGINDDTFYNFNGTQATATFMFDVESYYIDDGTVTGFMKPYYNDSYRFLALLPNENVSITDFINNLTGERFMELINSASEATVSTWMPKFKYECTVPMNDVLRSLGVTDAFSEDAADLHRLGHSDLGNLYIDEVFHYTFISVDSQGTKAGAATAIKMNGKSSGDAGKYSVNLNRPFVYAIIDTSTELPIFIGTIMDFDSIQE